MEKWIICDIDGTLLNQGKISSYTKEILIKAQKQGYRLFLASGRSPYTMQYFVKTLQLDQYFGIGICFNGGIIYNFKTNEIIEASFIDPKILAETIKLSQDAGLEVAIYSYDKIYVKQVNPQLTSGYYRNDEVYRHVKYIEVDDLLSLNVEAQKVGVALASEDQYQSLKPLVNQVNYVRINQGWMEKSVKNVDKGSAILKLLKQFKQDKANVYCFGDGENDISMFKVCGHAIAMGNAFDSLKQYATDITFANTSDGVAKYVEKYLLK